MSKRPSPVVEWLGVNAFLLFGALVLAGVMFGLGSVVRALDLNGWQARIAWLLVAVTAVAACWWSCWWLLRRLNRRR
jgi:hypothetical protein